MSHRTHPHFSSLECTYREGLEDTQPVGRTLVLRIIASAAVVVKGEEAELEESE